MKPVTIPKTEISGATELTPIEMNKLHFAFGTHSELPSS